MPNSEIKTYNEKRTDYRPYGLTCEMWKPDLMGKPDRHNEIEINLVMEGDLTYLFQGERITIPSKSFTLFWGLVPHQIVDFSGTTPYFVCTVPFTLFLEWNLPAFFVDKVLKGEVLIEKSGAHSQYDEFILTNWLDDLSINKGNHNISLLEIKARLFRMSERISTDKEDNKIRTSSIGMSKAEQIAMYIVKNYNLTIKVADIGNEVGLHPDYANSIFKQSFGMTIKDYIIQERIYQAQRRLISTDESISSICFECGFNSINRFNAAFKKINKCTPREFKRKFH